MGILRVGLSYALSVAVTVLAATSFYTQQVLAQQAAIGAVYTPAQQFKTYQENLIGLSPTYGVVLAIALALGFIVAAVLKRVLTPLATVAYPIAGAASVLTAIYLIENVVISGGVGVLGGARDALGFALQGVAGLIGGIIFAVFSRAR